MEQYGENPTFDQMLLALGATSSDPEGGSGVTFQTLKESIRAQGGIINPVIVQPASSGRYRVIEGNTRVAIYRSFRDDHVPGSWDAIPALIYKNLPAEEVDAIRLQCHIVGTREWDPYSKAKYIDHLLNIENLPLARIVDLCGGRKRQLTELVDAYHEMEKYYRPIVESDDSDDMYFDSTRFSAFVELQKPNIKTAIVEAGHTLSDFSTWVAKGNIDPLNTVRSLPRILKNPQAKSKFITVNAREALKILDVPASPALVNVQLDQLLTSLIERIDLLPYVDVVALCNDPGSARAQLLFQAKDTLSEICNRIGGEL
jgi:hypothetical protein